MRLKTKRSLLGSLCLIMLFSMLSNVGANGAKAAAFTGISDIVYNSQGGMMGDRRTDTDQMSVIKVTYAEAVLNGYGIEKRGPVYEDKDRLYDGEGYLSFFFAEDASFPDEAGNATFTVDAAEAGLYKMSIGYYIPEGYGGKATGIQVNGIGTGELMLDAPAAGTVRAEKMVSKVLLNAGKNSIKVTRGWGYYGIEHIKLEPAKDQPAGSLLEAEDGVMSGGVSIGASEEGYSGEGYVTFQQSGSLALTYKTPLAGTYDIFVGYSAPNGEKKTSIVLNGHTSEITLPETTGFIEIPAGKAWMNQGDNTIVFQANWGWYNIDYVKLTAAAKPEQREVASTLINPDATSEARALMNFMDSQYGQKIISGQQTSEDAEWIGQETGKYPAILATDLMDYSPSRVENGASSTEIEKMIAWYNRGGIVSLCWHWNAPKGIGGEEPGYEWWRGFYTEFTTFDVEYALDHPDSEDYHLLIRDIDEIAAQLKRLQNAGVPVLWRPLHEAEGGWFWWGAKGPEPAKRLWRLMVDRLTNYHRLNNLVWVWNSENPEWYPGDDVVDIASADIYNPAGDYNPSIAKYEKLVSLVNGKKVIGLAENGPIPDPEMLQAYGADWSFFTTWTGNFIKDGTTNSAEHLQRIYKHDYVLTLDELPADLYSSLKYEAEKGELTGLVISDEQGVYSGSGYVTGMDAQGGRLRIKANASPGTYSLLIRYKTDNVQTKNSISVNGAAAVEYTFADTAEWTDTVTGPYILQKGENTVDIISAEGGTDIDYIKLTRLMPSAETVSEASSSGSKGNSGITHSFGPQRIEVDGAELIAALKKQIGYPAESQLFVINAAGSEVTEFSFPASALAQAAAITPKARIVIQSDTGSYSLPVTLADVDAISGRLGAEADKIHILVNLRKLTNSQAREIRIQAKGPGARLDSDMYEFSVFAISDASSVQINHFGSRYVSHTITIPQVAGNGLTAVRVDPATGELSFIPAVFNTSPDGKTVVTIKRNGSGIYTIGQFNRTFDDLGSHWAKKDIEFMANKLLVHGTDDHHFAPNRLITRAEFTMLITRALGFTTPSRAVKFSDVPVTKWYAEAIGAAGESGLITGFSDGTFRPDALITREQMAVLIVRAAAIAGQNAAAAHDVLGQFHDSSSISNWAADSVNEALAAGLVQGLADDQFAAKVWVDRAQAAVVIKRLLNYLNFINS
ncbi:glycosyl hydrolase [Paenibacillus jilunlii]|uniref:Mannan endo-1,4-beta-mannosidase n=2 Tax=Paenibacillus jilunlii TaxID=682956 RepID=A0A1G9UQ77_9BACL|nr:mannan endo-1,4-beta-mannosidase [Paenibacillus jilunlii]